MTGTGRGRWDRRLSSEGRREVQRRLLLAATADAAARGHDVTTTRVVESAGVGRNTFYEHFDNVGEALLELQRKSATALQRGLLDSTANAHTPIERLRRLSAAWTETIAGNAESSRALFHVNPATGLAAELRQTLSTRLLNALEAAKGAGILAIAPEPLRVELIVGAFWSAALHVANHPEDARRAGELLADLAVRAFR